MEKMQSQQRYISDELTHFLWRELKDEDDAEQKQYDVLCKILHEGQLTPPPHNKPLLESAVSTYFNENAKPSQNEMVCPDTVCFCDIPLQDLNMQSKKWVVGNIQVRQLSFRHSNHAQGYLRMAGSNRQDLIALLRLGGNEAKAYYYSSHGLGLLLNSSRWRYYHRISKPPR